MAKQANRMMIGGFVVLEVERDAPLVPVHREEERALAVEQLAREIRKLPAGGRAGVARRVVGGIVVLMLLAGSGQSLWGYFRWEQKEDWRSAAAYVNQLPRESTLVVFVANEGELLYDYYRRQSGQSGHDTAGAPQRFLDLQPPRTIQRVLRTQDTQRLMGQIERDRPGRVVLVLSHTDFSDPNELTRQAIELRMEMVSEKSFAWVDVLEFRWR